MNQTFVLFKHETAICINVSSLNYPKSAMRALVHFMTRVTILGLPCLVDCDYRKSSHRAEKVEQEKTALCEIRPMSGIEKFYKYFEIRG